MATSMSGAPKDHLDHTAQALDNITESAGDHSKDPKDTLHAPSDHAKSHKWLKRIFPNQALDDMEAKWHMGNYVLDRKTHEKTWEAMSIYVRVGCVYSTNHKN